MTHSPYRGSTDGPEVLWWDYFNKGDVIVVTNEGSLIWFIDQKVDDFTNSLLSLTEVKISSSSSSPKASWTRYTSTSLGLMTVTTYSPLYWPLFCIGTCWLMTPSICHQASKVLKKWISLVPEALPGAGAPSWQSHRQDRRSMWAGFQQQGGLGSTTQGGPPPPVVGLKL